MRETMYENIFNHDKVACANPRDIETIDGIKYLKVHLLNNSRIILMRKDALVKVINNR
jgi:hypothetical protein